MEHYPVMKEKVLELLNPKEGGIYVDATSGYGGHSKYILKNSAKNIFLYCIDKDDDAIENLKRNLIEFKNFKAIKGGFENLTEILKNENVKKIDGIIFDLGFSIYQIKNPERGFSFSVDGPIDMRYDIEQNLNAKEILNKWSAKDLIYIFKNYGEIKNPERIVSKIIERRKKIEFETTREFADFISSITHRERKKIHPATKFFMALRIAVNNELEILKEGLKKAVILLKTNGRLVVISFHSLEDRLVKHFFRNNQQLKVLTRKPLLPEEKEVDVNPESRSAKMRVCEKI